MTEIQSKHTAKEKAILKTKYGIKDTANPLLELPLDLHWYGLINEKLQDLVKQSIFIHSSTPIETLHTILLGPYKYLLRSLMGRLNTAQKAELEARIESFDFSGFENKLSYNLCRHFRSFVGRDFKAIAECSLYLLGPYMSQNEKIVWLSLSKVYHTKKG